MLRMTPIPTTTHSHNGSRRFTRADVALIVSVLLIMIPCSALYNFDGFPLRTVSQGEVNGQVLQYSVMGLQNSPRTLEFDIPEGATVQWARTYVGVWGGTPRYSGWVQLASNGKDSGRTTLYGQDDKNPLVLCTGYGVYWTMWDTTDSVHSGHNTITATTSQAEPNNKMDGRIYGVTTVIVTQMPGGGDVRYWILEGNTNLHGQGWSQDATATVNDETSAQVTIPDRLSGSHANLTIIELTSTKGLPDYVRFNGEDLGSGVTDTTNYPAGAKDIADEISFNDGYKDPVPSRYWDIEIFDVTSGVRQGTNTITIQRGRDLNGDGTISSTGEKPEGEDYLHPVFAMLTVEKPTVSSAPVAARTTTGVDLAIGDIEVTNAYSGENATMTATLQNLGTRPAAPVTVEFLADGITVASRQVTVDSSGIQKVSTGWRATAGSHTIKASVMAGADRDASNNIREREVMVGSLPDLAVSSEAPHRPGAATPGQKTPLLPALSCAAVVISLAICHRMKKPLQDNRSRHQIASVFCTLLLVTAMFSTCIPRTSAADATSLYLLPVIVKNTGGSDAPAFTVTIYLDGEKTATRVYDSGLAAGGEVRTEIPVHTTPGSHTVRIIADEAGKLQDGNRENNMAESAYDFP